MKLRKYDHISNVILTGLLLWDLHSQSVGIVDCFNYLYLAFVVIRCVIFYLQYKKNPTAWKELTLSVQWGIILDVIATILFVTLAVLDMF